MISHTHKIIFIHIPKCAGTSIENALGHYEGHIADRGGQDHRSIRMIEQPWFQVSALTNTANLRELIRRYRYPKSNIINQNNRKIVTRQQYDDYYKFTIVRNPWTRAYSWYKNVLNDEVHKKRFGVTTDTSLEQFLNKFAGHGMLQTQLYYIENFQGQIPLDFIGRFENLSADFRKVCTKLGLQNLTLPHKVKGASSDYREHYTKRAVERIRQVYAAEIERFDYTFDAS